MISPLTGERMAPFPLHYDGKRRGVRRSAAHRAVRRRQLCDPGGDGVGVWRMPAGRRHHRVHAKHEQVGVHGVGAAHVQHSAGMCIRKPGSQTWAQARTATIARSCVRAGIL
eukprot:gene4045-biopygen17334